MSATVLHTRAEVPPGAPSLSEDISDSSVWLVVGFLSVSADTETDSDTGALTGGRLLTTSVTSVRAKVTRESLRALDARVPGICAGCSGVALLVAGLVLRGRVESRGMRGTWPSLGMPGEVAVVALAGLDACRMPACVERRGPPEPSARVPAMGKQRARPSINVELKRCVRTRIVCATVCERGSNGEGGGARTAG